MKSLKILTTSTIEQLEGKTKQAITLTVIFVIHSDMGISPIITPRDLFCSSTLR